MERSPAAGPTCEPSDLAWIQSLISCLAPRQPPGGGSQWRRSRGGAGPVPDRPEFSAEPMADSPGEIRAEGRPGIERALRTIGPAGLSRMPAAELARACGLTMGHACRVEAAFHLGREVERGRSGPRPSLKAPCAVARLMAPDLRGLEVEAFHALYLDARHRLKGRSLVGQGTLTSAPVHPREVFGPGLRLAAAAVIVVHNHPSGDLEPSAADIAVTRRLVEAGETLGVPLLDHVIWGDGDWVSLRERGDWPR